MPTRCLVFDFINDHGRQPTIIELEVMQRSNPLVKVCENCKDRILTKCGEFCRQVKEK